MSIDVSRFALAVLVIATVAIACGQPPASEPAPEEMAEETAPAEPVTGQIAGTLQDLDTGDPVSGVNLALMIRGEGEGQWVQMEKTDFTARSDEEGAFVFENVPPNRYLVFAAFGSIATLPNTMLRDEGGTGITIDLAPGEVHDLDIIRVKREG